MNNSRLSGVSDMGISNLAWSRAGKKRDLCLPRRVFLTDDDRVADPVAVVGTLPPGSVVIARSRAANRVPKLVAALRPICRARGVFLLAATDIRAARALDVDGVHLSEVAVRRAGRSMLSFPTNWLVTAAAHSPAAVKCAARLGADIVLISPVFPTDSHPGATTLGVYGYRRLAQLVPDRACPLGGITPQTLKRLYGAPVAAVAGIDLFLDKAGSRDDA